ncbi:hypothetical protein BD779DRAFT_299892 [Infundibulicybe gibba]|nr:hypothetical protein BD779DRAFT_299892 [Infundibulicybe gibba]
MAKANTDVNSKNSDGDSPLSLVARESSDMIMKLLLDRGSINVNPVNSDSKTPLDYTVQESYRHKRTTKFRRKRVMELLRAAGSRTGRELGVKPQEDAGSGGKRAGIRQKTMIQQRTKIRQRKEDKDRKVGEDKEDGEDRGGNVGDNKENPRDDRKMEEDDKEREKVWAGGYRHTSVRALSMCFLLLHKN